MRGLPALKRAVPAHILDKFRSRGPRSGADRGEHLLGLIAGLPPELRTLALTHSSRAASRVESNERLEFLGDSVLGLAVAAELFRRFPESEEGELARLKSYVVSRANCSDVADQLAIGKLMAAEAKGSGHHRGGATRSKSMVGNALEALIGACFLTYGMEETALGVAEAFEEAMQRGADKGFDPKTTLQEVLAQKGLQPQYRLVSEDGPAHARVFTSEVTVDDSVRGSGTGTTIKMSEQSAAREALLSYGIAVGDR